MTAPTSSDGTLTTGQHNFVNARALITRAAAQNPTNPCQRGLTGCTNTQNIVELVFPAAQFARLKPDLGAPDAWLASCTNCSQLASIVDNLKSAVKTIVDIIENIAQAGITIINNHLTQINTVLAPTGISVPLLPSVASDVAAVNTAFANINSILGINLIPPLP